MRRRIRRVISTISVVLSVILAAGCAGWGGSPAAPAVEKPNLTVAAVPVADGAGLYIAAEQGLFKAEGLNVTIVPIVSSADATRDQNNGKYDITAGNSVSYIQAQVSHQSNLEVIAEGSLMRPGNQALYTLPGSPITTIADLKGQRIGVNALNNIGTLLISSLLEEHGMSPREVHFVVVNFPQMAHDLQDHAIGAAWLPEPFGSVDAENFGLQELADLDQGATANFPIGWYVVTKAWAKRYPRTLAAFLDALSQGQKIADTDRAAVEQAMETLPPPYTVPPVVASIMSIETYPLITAPNINPAPVQRVANAMYQFQMLPQQFRASSMLG